MQIYIQYAKRLLLLGLFVCVSLLPVHVAMGSSLDTLATSLKQKVMSKVIDKTPSQQENFLNVLIRALKKHEHKHPVLPLLQTELQKELKNITHAGSTEIIVVSSPSSSVVYDLDKIDVEKVKKQWIQWYNELRKSKGLHPYTWNADLDKTAQEWAETLAQRNSHIQGFDYPKGGVHWRNSSDEGYYNYTIITDWFAQRGITQSATENVGYGSYFCLQSDCTDVFIGAIKKTYNFFAGEESWDGPHRRSLVSSHYDEIGLGLVVEAEKNKYWLVVHYGDAE